MKLIAFTILKMIVHFYLYFKNLYIYLYMSFVSTSLTYCKSKNLYVYTFYDNNNKYKRLYFMNHKDFRDYLALTSCENNLQIVHAALVTDTDYIVDLTDHVKSFSYYFKDLSTIPWRTILSDTVAHATHDTNGTNADLKMYIQSTHTTGNSIAHSERTVPIK